MGNNMVRVKDLMEQLKALNPETPVLVDAYEDGYDYPMPLKIERVVENPQVDEDDEDGPDEWIGQFRLSHEGEKGLAAAILPRGVKAWGD